MVEPAKKQSEVLQSFSDTKVIELSKIQTQNLTLSEPIVCHFPEHSFPTHQVENGKFYASTRFLSAKEMVVKTTSNFEATKRFIESAPHQAEFNQKYYRLYNSLASLFFVKDKEVKQQIIANLYELKFETNISGYWEPLPCKAELEEIRNHILVAYANPQGKLDIYAESTSQYHKLRLCAEKFTSFNRKHNLPGPQTEEQFENSCRFPLNLKNYATAHTLVPCGAKTKNGWFGRSINLSVKEFVESEVLDKNQKENNAIVQRWRNEQLLERECVNLKIVKNTNAWQEVVRKKKEEMLLTNPEWAQAIALKTRYEDAVRKQLEESFNVKKREPAYAAIEELTNLSMSEKTLPARDQLLLDIATGKKYKHHHEALVLPSGVLKCYAKQKAAYALDFDRNHTSQFKDRAIIAANKLCAYELVVEEKYLKNLVASTICLERACQETDIEVANDFLTIAEGYVKALEGEEFYKYLLKDESSFWPYRFRHGGPIECDFDLMHEYATQMQIWEELKVSEANGNIFFQKPVFQKPKHPLDKFDHVISPMPPNPNDPEHDEEFQKLKAEIEELIEKINNTEIMKKHNIKFTLETVYHSSHGNVRDLKITGFHQTSGKCCFELEIRGIMQTHGLQHGKVRAINKELQAFYQNKNFTTAYGSRWGTKEILQRIYNSLDKNKIRKIKADKYIIEDICPKCKMEIELNVNPINGNAVSHYPYWEWMKNNLEKICEETNY